MCSKFELALADWWSSEWHQSRSNYSVPGHHIRHRGEPEPIGRRKSPANRLVIDAEKSRWLTGCERCSRLSRSRKLRRVAPLTVVAGSNHSRVLSHRQDLSELFTITFESWRIEESVWCILMRFVHHLYKPAASQLVVWIYCTFMRDAKLYRFWQNKSPKSLEYGWH